MDNWARMRTAAQGLSAAPLLRQLVLCSQSEQPSGLN